MTATGILGDPTGATAGEGAALLDELAGALTGMVHTWRGP